jgi:hypothetical protein
MICFYLDATENGNYSSSSKNRKGSYLLVDLEICNIVKIIKFNRETHSLYSPIKSIMSPSSSFPATILSNGTEAEVSP